MMKISLKPQAIIFDFDGVILDSMAVKSNAFVELFRDYPKWAIDAIVNYHTENGGMSRRQKIEYFYSQIIKEKAPCELSQLEEKFGCYVLKILQDPALVIKDCSDFIQNTYPFLPLFVASAAPEDEVIELLKHHRLFHYFTAIGGSPRLKSDIINDFLVRFDLDSESCVLIGDSVNDLKAAQKSGVHFWGYNNSDLEGKCTYVTTLSTLTVVD